MTDAIPVIDVADYLAGRPGALQATARALHDALTTVGFLVLTGHDVPQGLIAQTFAEAKRLHDLPMASKLALRLNEHNNGYMAMGRYAVWTSDVNKNDKGDLNEAFFIKRERTPDDPLLRSGRRFVGANVWPDETALPRFRQRSLDTPTLRMALPAVCCRRWRSHSICRPTGSQRPSNRVSSPCDCRTIRRSRPIPISSVSLRTPTATS